MKNFISFVSRHTFAFLIGATVFASVAGFYTFGFFVREWNKAELGAYIVELMDLSRCPDSKIKRSMTARMIVDVASDIFSSQDQRKGFAVLISIESKFINTAKSPVGAQGYTQVMPQYAKAFAKDCGIADFKDEDLMDPMVNILVGACRFKALIEAADGNVAAALAAYNAGASSTQLKQLKALRGISNEETSGYINKFFYLSEEARKSIDPKKVVSNFVLKVVQ